MNKIYTLKKEILFKNNIYDILSLDIDKSFNINGHKIEGTITVKGDYLVRENEQDIFNIDIPYLNYIEDEYNTDNCTVDIDDFYYEIKDSNKLVVNIDIIVDNLEEESRFEVEDVIEKENNILETSNEVNNEEINRNDNFVTYKVYIVRDGDTIESIIDKYNISIDTLKKYNTINEINNGDKLIIPYERN